MAHTGDCPTCAAIQAILFAKGFSAPVAHEIAYSSPVRGAERKIKAKAKRKVSKYQREFGRQLKKLKKKHPRTPATKLMKRAHSATKRSMK